MHAVHDMSRSSAWSPEPTVKPRDKSKGKDKGEDEEEDEDEEEGEDEGEDENKRCKPKGDASLLQTAKHPKGDVQKKRGEKKEGEGGKGRCSPRRWWWKRRKRRC